MNSYKGQQVSAHYTDSLTSKHRGNPLVEPLPTFLEEDAFINALRINHPITDKLFEINTIDALEIIDELDGTFYPLTKHYQQYEQIYLQMRRSYDSRNPLAPSYRQSENELSKRLKGKAKYHMDNPLPYSALTSTILTSGIAGTGKTVSLRRTLNLFPQVILHESYKGEVFKCAQIVWMSFDMKVSRSKKELVKAFFRELDRVLGFEESKHFLSSKMTIDDLLHAMQLAVHKYHIGIMHIDEVQYALNRTKTDKETPSIPELEAMFNTVAVPLILSTTEDALSRFKQNTAESSSNSTALQTVRRMSSSVHIQLTQWTLKSPQTTEFFNTFFSLSLFKNHHALSEGFKMKFLVLCAGVPDAMTQLAIAFIRNWYKQVKKEGPSCEIDMDRLLAAVYKARFSSWHEQLDLLRANYKVQKSNSNNSVATRSHDKKKVVSGQESEEDAATDWAEDVQSSTQPKRRTNKRRPKKANRVERINEGDEVIDADSIINGHFKVKYDNL